MLSWPAGMTRDFLSSPALCCCEPGWLQPSWHQSPGVAAQPQRCPEGEVGTSTGLLSHLGTATQAPDQQTSALDRVSLALFLLQG